MLLKIKNKIEQELLDYLNNLNQIYSLSKISPVLYKFIKDFVSRKGKRVRPTLFIIGYLGFAKRIASGLYTSALSLELLHDFMLVHDDIIDKSDTRRGKPSMHKMLNNYLAKYHKDIKFNGQDLAIVAGDVMYATAIHAFLSINEDMVRKEKALRNFIKAAIFTGSGEFIELLYGIKDIAKITKQDIYKIYDYKTAHYTFSSPLCSGAILAGARNEEIQRLTQYGIYLGRAFQIKDDILGMFADEEKIGKSTLTDLQEAKKTLLIWYTYHHSSLKNRRVIKRIFAKETVCKADLSKIRKIIILSSVLDFAKKELFSLRKRAQSLLKSSLMKAKYKAFLAQYSQEILDFE
jgi:geranylgeranyl diphosphate synthase type I